MNVSQSRAINAAEVLPADLLAAVQGHVRGRYLYIPSPDTAVRKTRDDEILALRAAGHKLREIAGFVGLTERRVCAILSRAKGAAEVAQ